MEGDEFKKRKKMELKDKTEKWRKNGEAILRKWRTQVQMIGIKSQKWRLKVIRYLECSIQGGHLSSIFKYLISFIVNQIKCSRVKRLSHEISRGARKVVPTLTNIKNKIKQKRDREIEMIS